jgi:hypothetical protein
VMGRGARAYEQVVGLVDLALDMYSPALMV